MTTTHIFSKQCRRRMLATFSMLVTACHAITDTQLPDGVESPATYNNPEGAIRLTQAARNELAKTIASYIVSSGLLTDELGHLPTAQTTATPNRDKRTGHWFSEGPPHTVRALARLARGVVGKYVPGTTSGWQSLLLMYEAYAEILTAEGWCSGVPLSTLDFEGDWTYRPGSATDEIYAHAIQLLDSAEARAADSVSVQSAIRVLKARAQLASGHYAEAGQTAQSIDGTFRYQLRIAFGDWKFRLADSTRYLNFASAASISNSEGINGLPYRSSGDPRTQAIFISNRQNSRDLSAWFPAKYIAADSSTFTLASGIEAQLILAEVALHEHHPDEMLTRLNALRTTGTYTVDTVALAGGGTRVDTLWQAGSGGVAGLRPFVTLPGSPDAQRRLLFAERAAWLFVTGARQGDLRRLVRKYGLDRESVYPTGDYIRPGYTDVYGTDISFGLSSDESRNPLFTGCRYDD